MIGKTDCRRQRYVNSISATAINSRSHFGALVAAAAAAALAADRGVTLTRLFAVLVWFTGYPTAETQMS